MSTAYQFRVLLVSALALAALILLAHQWQAVAFAADCQLEGGAVQDRAGARWCHVAGDGGRFHEWPQPTKAAR